MEVYSILISPTMGRYAYAHTVLRWDFGIGTCCVPLLSDKE